MDNRRINPVRFIIMNPCNDLDSLATFAGYENYTVSCTRSERGLGRIGFRFRDFGHFMYQAGLRSNFFPGCSIFNKKFVNVVHIQFVDTGRFVHQLIRKIKYRITRFFICNDGILKGYGLFERTVIF